MGIEFVFFGILVIFAVTGLTRGYKQELGVTIVLMLAVCLLELTEAKFSMEFNSLLNFAINSGPVYREAIRGLLYCLILLMVVFLAYQSDFLRFPGPESSRVLSLGSGMLNGYLLAGSLWYYLSQAGWPFLPFVGPYSAIYRTAWNMLPPNVLTWPLLFVFALGIIMVRCFR